MIVFKVRFKVQPFNKKLNFPIGTSHQQFFASQVFSMRNDLNERQTRNYKTNSYILIQDSFIILMVVGIYELFRKRDQRLFL